MDPVQYMIADAERRGALKAYRRVMRLPLEAMAKIEGAVMAQEAAEKINELL